MRCGKLTFAALEATLRLYFDKEKLVKSHPALKFMLRTEAELEKKAIELKNGLNEILSNRGEAQIEKGFSEIGGGSLATESLTTILVNMTIEKFSTEELGKKLRLSDPPIITRIVNDRIVFDLRTLFDDEIEKIIAAVDKLIQDWEL